MGKKNMRLVFIKFPLKTPPSLFLSFVQQTMMIVQQNCKTRTILLLLLLLHLIIQHYVSLCACIMHDISSNIFPWCGLYVLSRNLWDDIDDIEAVQYQKKKTTNTSVWFKNIQIQKHPSVNECSYLEVSHGLNLLKLLKWWDPCCTKESCLEDFYIYHILYLAQVFTCSLTLIVWKLKLLLYYF